MKKIILSFLYITCHILVAQNQKISFVNFPVASLELQNPGHVLSDKNIYIAEIELNGFYEFEEKAGGKVFALAENGQNNRKTFVGVASIHRKKENRLSLKITTEKGISLQIGDLIQMPTIVPNEANTLAYDLFRFRINFLNSYDDKLFNCEEWSTYHAETEIALIQTLADEVRFYGGEMRGKMPSQPLKGGKYQDLDMFDAMVRTSAEDMRNFLHFIRSYPAHYAGQDWKIAEIYVTWLTHDMPAGKLEYSN